jgi:ribonuclease HI
LVSTSTSFIKLNFDRASKGNLGRARVGGVFRDYLGNILRVFVRFLGSNGSNTNNAIELEALEIGLHISIAQKYQRLIVEGNSLILVNSLKCLLNGTKLEKMTRNW